MKSTQLVSVIIPAYNSVKYIDDTLNSVVNQTYQNLEILVSDDFSSDETRLVLNKWLEKDPRISAHHNKENLGYLKTCNKLKSLAKGDFIIFQDSDDYSALNRIEILLNYFKENPSVDMVGSNFTKVTEEGNKISDSNYPESHEAIVSVMPETFLFCGATFMLRKKVYDAIGGYNEYFDRIGAEDMYWIYLIAEKFKIASVPDSLYFYRFNPNSVSSDWSEPRKLFSMDTARFLIKQRIETGSDALERNNTSELENEVSRLNEPYVNDRLLYRKKMTQRLFWNSKYTDAYKSWFGVFFRNPFQNKEFYKNFIVYFPRLFKK